MKKVFFCFFSSHLSLMHYYRYTTKSSERREDFCSSNWIPKHFISQLGNLDSKTLAGLSLDFVNHKLFINISPWYPLEEAKYFPSHDWKSEEICKVWRRNLFIKNLVEVMKMMKEDLFGWDGDGNDDEYDDEEEDGIGNFPRLNKWWWIWWWGGGWYW